MDTYQNFIIKSRYSRWIEDLGRRETWEETVDRYINFFMDRLDKQGKLSSKVKARLDECRNAILNLEVMPSMRCLMTAGKALDRDHVAGYNCAYLPINHPHCFDEVLYCLTCGTGVGFSVESEDVSQLPDIPFEMYPSETVIVVPDSKIGWATSLRELISMLYAGKVPSWDVSRVRPAGARLKTFGGRASGPQPLVDLFNFVVAIFKKAAGRKLRPIECHDIVCKIADIVVVGGVRRSALLSLSDLSDGEMRDCKSGRWWESNTQRALANNSAVFNTKPDLSTFMDEWMALYRSGSGERGIFNRYSVKKHITKNQRRDASSKFGANPCCVPGDCLVLTDRGYFPIEKTVGLDVNVWNGNEFSKVVPFYTGKQPIRLVKFSDGTSLECTENHKFILNGNIRKEAKDLTLGDKLAKFDMPVIDGTVKYSIDAYSQGFYSGDGNTDLNHSWVYSTKYCCLDRLVGNKNSEGNYGRITWKHGPMLSKSFVPIDGTISYKINWLAGLLDADGTVTRDLHGNGLQVVSTDKSFLNSLRLMLTTLGVRAKVVDASAEGIRLMPDGSGGQKEYFCNTTYRLLIGNFDTYKLVNLGLKTNRLLIHGNPPQRDARQFVRVVSVDLLPGEVDTFCFNEPLNHSGTFNGIVTGQCEILLRPFQFCNLTSVQLSPDETPASACKKVQLATILGTLQSSLTDFRYLRRIWKKNCEEERLLGVSLSGICDSEYFSTPDIKLKTTLNALKELAIETNKEWAELIGISPSTAITCIKPEGTTSQACDRSSGIHPRYSEYYIRTVRADKKDPLAVYMKEAGFPCEDDVTKPNSTLVFSFPIKSPQGSKVREDMTAIDQLELWLCYKQWWAEHTISCTVYVRDNEWLKVADWVYDHFDEVSGISFLPYSDHVYRQAPYQPISMEEYLKSLESLPKEINWDKLGEYEKEDQTTGTHELACQGGSCELT